MNRNPLLVELDAANPRHDGPFNSYFIGALAAALDTPAGRKAWRSALDTARQCAEEVERGADLARRA